jgi:hypothetical protein
VGLGTLLADGVGDTIRISLSTFHAEEEVKVAWEILKALGLRERGPVLIACPTCGRLQFDMDTVVAEIESRLEHYTEPIEVAVLGCAVNGIGEASHADFGITGAKNEGLIFAHGKPLRKVPQSDLVDALFEEIDRSLNRGAVAVDAGEAAEGAAWLKRIEDENADELTPERIAQMEAAAARSSDPAAPGVEDEEAAGSGWSELARTTSTSAKRRGEDPSPPAKIMSCIDCPRTASGLCSPSAHRTASVMFDFPQPFGPTITLTPGENTSLVRSGKDLKPLIVIELRCNGIR